ncbi:MAG: ABC transporter ATP-binding protein [Candidatus Korobacteraceae bacterium]
MRLLRYARPYAPHLLSTVVLMALVGLLDAFRLLLIGPMLDRVLHPASQSRDIALFTIPGTQHTVYLQSFVPQYFQNAWTVVAVSLVAATVIKGICFYAGTYLVNLAGFGVITDLRNELYGSVLRRSVAFFQKHTTGTLISAIVNDIDKIQFATSQVLAEFLQQFFTLIFIAAVVVALGGKFAWVLLIFVPFIVFSAGRLGRRVRSTTRKGQDRLAEIQNILHETLAGNRIVKAFGMEGWETSRFHGAANRLLKANMRSVAAAAVSSPMMDIFGAVAISLLLLLGRDQIKANVFTPGTFVAFIFAVFKLYDPVRKFATFYNNFQQALGASTSVFQFMDADDEVKEKPRALVLPAFHQEIAFDHVNFSYNDGDERDVLRDIDLSVHAGEVLAIVGSSGSGKSTLVHLLPRFFDVTAGAIRIDGHDLRDVTLSSLRSQIGIVAQDTILFNDTVRNNIAYGQTHASQQKVLEAAKAALAHDFISAMPEGYNTVIGERGFRLSGGERQRLSIARALLKNAPILVLDEATSALDSESERLVQQALHNLMAGRTAFVIAHRLSTVRRADRIVVLENGTISDVGSHEDLLTRLGTYRRLYELQFVDLEPVGADAARGALAEMP